MKKIDGDRVKELRQRAGFSLKSLATMASGFDPDVKVTRDDVNNIERHRSPDPSFLIVSAIAKALEVSPDSLYRSEEVVAT